jgi:hypothetical protein
MSVSETMAKTNYELNNFIVVPREIRVIWLPLESLLFCEKATYTSNRR